MKVRYDMVACFVARPGLAGQSHELLQLRRAPGESLAGAWSTARGGIEAGETAWQAALRELYEETSVTPESFYQLDTVDIFYLRDGDTLWHCPAFCAIVPRDVQVTLNHEHDDFRWVTRAQIDTKFMWPGERTQLAELCREILDDGPAKPYLRIGL